jgi:thiamine-phosphate pyrophosphorylase
MPHHQPLPLIWLMTDERQGENLFAAIAQLPRGAGIVFRHHGLAPRDRRRLFDRVRTLARRRRLMLLLAGPPALARAWRADGSHGRGRASGVRSAPVHDLVEIRAAERDGAALLFLSPLYATRSHPGAKPLGRVRFANLARQARRPVIALGGIDRRRARKVRDLGADGWAGIDAWSGPSKGNLR